MCRWMVLQVDVLAQIPFKDIAGFENNRTGMTPQRAEGLGRSFFDAVKSIAPYTPKSLGQDEPTYWN